MSAVHAAGGLAATALARGGGGVLAAATAGVDLVRPAEKPLHPRGRLHRGTLVRHGRTGAGSGTRSGSPWLDDPGEHPVLVRRSRAVGLPAPLPDIHGVAVRLPGGGDSAADADVLLATTGWGPLGRFLLAPRREALRPMTTLMPYRTPRGPVLLGARPDGPLALELSWAPWRGGWRRFARLELEPDDVGDPLLSFDPVLNPLPTLGHYPAVTRLREPAYGVARARRAGRRERRSTPG